MLVTISTLGFRVGTAVPCASTIENDVLTNKRIDVYYNDHPEVWVRIGGTDTGVNTGHGSTYYNRYMKLNPDLNSGPAYGLYYATEQYLAAHPEISQICTNDMALPFGGKFDIHQDWTNPHHQHDRGTAADVAATTSTQCANAGGSGVNISEFIADCVDNGASSTYSFSEATPPHAHWAGKLRHGPIELKLAC